MNHKRIAAACLILGVCAYILVRPYADFSRRRAAFGSLKDSVEAEASRFSGEAGVIIRDLGSGWEIAIGDDTTFPSASVVKIPIMAACFYAVKKGDLDLGETITLKGAHKVLGSGVLKAKPSGEKYSVKELIRLMIAESDNTATNILIDRLGFDYLNDMFREMGLEDTNIDRKMMDFEKRRKGIENYTSAKDIALLLDRMYRGKLIDRETSDQCIEFLKEQRSKNRIPAKLPPDIPVAHKTGLERGICHDAGIVFTPKGDLLICVLTKHTDRSSRQAKKFISHVAARAYYYRLQA
ncbi:MAG: serine hydrolase [Candidatus Omnitrophota bacterium]